MYEAKKNQQNLQFLYILAYNSANKPSFQNLTKRLKSVCWLLKRWHINRVNKTSKHPEFFCFASNTASILKS